MCRHCEHFVVYALNRVATVPRGLLLGGHLQSLALETIQTGLHDQPHWTKLLLKMMRREDDALGAGCHRLPTRAGPRVILTAVAL